jgi:hypothetical protein
MKMVSLKDKVDSEPLVARIAKLSGAKLSPPPETDEDSLRVDLPDLESLSDPDFEDEELDQDSGKTFIQQEFNDQQKPWKNPKVKLAVIAIPAFAIVFGLVGLLMGDFKFQLNGPQGSAQSESPPPDDTQPKTATAGQLQAQGLARSLTGVNNGGQDNLGQPTPALPSVTPPVQTTPTVVMPPQRTAVPAPLRGYRSVPSGYERPTAPSRFNRSYGRSAGGSGGSSTTGTSRPNPQTRQQLQDDAQKRWLALTGATTTGGMPQGSPNGSDTPRPDSGNIPNGTGSPVNPRLSPPAILASEQALLDGQPQTLIPRSTKAMGRLLMGLAFTQSDFQGLVNQPVEIEISEPGETNLPRGARIIATVAPPGGSGGYGSGTAAVVRLIPSALVLGDLEIPLDGAAMVVSGKGNKPLLARSRGPGFFKSLIGTISQGIGSIGLGGLGANQNRLLYSIGGNVGSTLFGNPNQRLASPNQDVLALDPNLEVSLHVVRPISLPRLETLGGANGK